MDSIGNPKKILQGFCMEIYWKLYRGSTRSLYENPWESHRDSTRISKENSVGNLKRSDEDFFKGSMVVLKERL